MSVIAKMDVRSSGVVPSGALITLGCVYDNDLSHASNEDVRFTKASPWGEARFENREPLKEGEAYYLLFDEIDDAPNFDDCDIALKVRCHVIHDYGQSKQVEIHTGYDQDGVPREKVPSLSSAKPPFHLKMTIDNPAASLQFKPQRDYILTIWRAARFQDMDEVLCLARKTKADADADAPAE